MSFRKSTSFLTKTSHTLLIFSKDFLKIILYGLDICRNFIFQSNERINIIFHTFSSYEQNENQSKGDDLQGKNCSKKTEIGPKKLIYWNWMILVFVFHDFCDSIRKDNLLQVLFYSKKGKMFIKHYGKKNADPILAEQVR